MDTPWGKTDFEQELAPGITIVTTPSHGGIVLDDAHAKLVPAEIVNFLDNEKYWEEDCDMALPLVLFAAELNDDNGARRARAALENYHPEWLEAIDKEIT